MNDILAASAALSHCPPWCSGGHLPTGDNGFVHISVDQTVHVSSPCGRESGELYVALEQSDGRPVAVRLEGASSAPMTPAQAMQLASVLQTVAFAAISGEAQR